MPQDPIDILALAMEIDSITTCGTARPEDAEPLLAPLLRRGGVAAGRAQFALAKLWLDDRRQFLQTDDAGREERKAAVARAERLLIEAVKSAPELADPQFELAKLLHERERWSSSAAEDKRWADVHRQCERALVLLLAEVNDARLRRGDSPPPGDDDEDEDGDLPGLRALEHGSEAWLAGLRKLQAEHRDRIAWLESPEYAEKSARESQQRRLDARSCLALAQCAAIHCTLQRELLGADHALRSPLDESIFEWTLRHDLLSDPEWDGIDDWINFHCAWSDLRQLTGRIDEAVAGMWRAAEAEQMPYDSAAISASETRRLAGDLAGAARELTRLRARCHVQGEVLPAYLGMMLAGLHAQLGEEDSAVEMLREQRALCEELLRDASLDERSRRLIEGELSRYCKQLQPDRLLQLTILAPIKPIATA